MKNADRRMFLFAAACFLAAAARGDDWPHWRGPNRNDIVREASGWKSGNWLTAEPAWSKNIGAGGSAPLVVNGRVYAIGWNQGKDRVTCLDAATGKERWAVSYPCPEYARFRVGDEGFYSGPSSTPEFDAATGLLYTLSIDGDLHCWDTAKEGRKLWGLNLYEKFGVKRRPKIGRRELRDYGYTSSPLVWADSVLVEVGAKEGCLMAFDKKTGERQWTSACKDEAGHNTGPAPITVEGVPCVALFTLRHLVVIRLDKGNEGKTVAEYPWETDFSNNIASPAVLDNFVLITSGYNRKAICKLEITLKGARKVWEQPYYSLVCTPVIHKGHVYWSWQTLKCLDWETGKLRWQGGSFGTPGSCIVTGDERIIVWGKKGKLVLAETAQRSPEAYKELAVKEPLAATEAWPHVVLSGGRLFCRDRAGNLHCFKLE